MHLLGQGSPAVSTLLVVSPAGAERMGNVELVQKSAREVPHQPCKRGLAAVKGRHEGHDAGPGPGRCPSEELCGHKCQRGVNAVVDRFVRTYHPAAFLKFRSRLGHSICRFCSLRNSTCLRDRIWSGSFDRTNRKYP